MDKKFKRVLTSLKPSRGESASPSSGSAPTTAAAPADVIQEGDTIENNIARAIHAFSASGGPGNPNPGEEVLYLPTIVDLAESGPAACKAAAYAIRKNLSVANNSGKPFVQYNSIMLLRILSDNPGPTFTRSLDDPKFIAALKDLVRQGRDPSVWQILCETLDYLSDDKAIAADENLAPIKKFWEKEKRNIDAARKKLHGPAADPANPNAQMMIPTQAQLFSAHGAQRPTLPPMQELTSRISEAQTSAKVLAQILDSTPTVDVPTHELIREFAQRCKLALRSIQGFLATDEATLDESTTTTLIETNDLLSSVLEKHRKAVKEANEVLARQEAEKEEAEAEGPGEDPFRDQPSPVSPVSPQPTANAGPVQYRF